MDEKSSLLSPKILVSKKQYSGNVPSTIHVDDAQHFESVTYTWNNINVWVGAEDKSNNVGNGSGISVQLTEGKQHFNIPFPWKKKNGNVQSKQILKNVNGIVRPGELLAIMGSSGAGKTSLLNVLTFRNTEKLRVSGSRGINGVPVGPDTLTANSAYVQQDDLFIGTLTVREHLIFQALVRMHRYLPRRQRMIRVEEVIQEFGLIKCADTLIGIPGRIKGISGGEIKRLAFASEVLTDPMILFCDEPTSGLDSFMAQQVVRVLKSMAEKGKSIVCTIHQPSSELYSMFDRICLMSEGRCAFLGDTKDAVKFFTEQGFECPSTFNPADYFIEVLAIQPGDEENSLRNVTAICDGFEQSGSGQEIRELTTLDESKSGSFECYEERFSSPYKATWFQQFNATLWRSWLTILREPMVLRTRVIQTAITAILLGIIYFRQDINQDGVMNINGALFLFLTNMTFQNIFAVINVFCSELRIFLREHFNGMYRSDVYFLSKTLAELPLFIIFPIVFTSLCYFVIGLNPDLTRFATSCLVVVLVSNAACSFGYMISCISPTLTVALSVAAPAIIPLMIFGGFFLNKESVPIYFIWLKYLSWFMYGNEALVVNQWDGIGTIDCTRSNTTCPANGEVVLESLNFETTNLNFDMIMLVVLIFAYRIVAYLALLSKTYRK